MSLNLLDNNGKTNSLSGFNNPFDKDGVTNVNFFFSKKPSFMRNNKRGEAIVYFKKNDTEGKQTIYSDDFQDLVKQVDNFINSLK